VRIDPCWCDGIECKRGSKKIERDEQDASFFVPQKITQEMGKRVGRVFPPTSCLPKEITNTFWEKK
jgi:hypothetical protein